MVTPARGANRDMTAALARLSGRRVETADMIVQADGSQWLQLVGADWHATIAPEREDEAEQDSRSLYVAFLDGRETLVPGAEATVTEVSSLKGASLAQATIEGGLATDTVVLQLENGGRLIVRLRRADGGLEVLAQQ